MVRRKTETDIVVAEPMALAALSENRYAEIDAIEDGIAYDVVLPRLHVAAGGARNFQDDGGQTYGDLDCIVGVSRKSRAYWPQAFGAAEAGRAPQCVSRDGRFGDGDPGGACGVCRLSRFGADGERPACTEMRRLVVLTADKGAFLLTLKPGSMGAWDKYCTMLRTQGLRYYTVRTQLVLEQAQNTAGIRFTRVAPMLLAELPDAKRDAQVEQYGSWASLLDARDIEPDEDADADVEV